MHRYATIPLLTALLATPCLADVIIVRKGSRLEVVGMPDKVENEATGEEIAITPDNVEIYAPEKSTGVIVKDGYDVIEIQKRAKSKEEAFPRSDVVKVVYTTQPASLLDGEDQMALGAWAQAIGLLRDVVEDPEARQVFKDEANFRIGQCFLGARNYKNALSQFNGWASPGSKFTPQVYSIISEIYADQKNFPAARASLEKIAGLPGITDSWKLRAKLGAVKVDLAERKYAEAEKAAATIAREAKSGRGMEDVQVTAAALQARAILLAGDTERLKEAQALLEPAEKIEPVEPGTRAFLYLTLGNVVYAQRRPEDARFAYLRCALMYPGTGLEGDAFYNAGLCFIDLSGRKEFPAGTPLTQEAGEDLFIKGMKLLGTAAGRYGNREAAKYYRDNKKRFDELEAKRGEKSEDESGPTSQGMIGANEQKPPK